MAGLAMMPFVDRDHAWRSPANGNPRGPRPAATEDREMRCQQCSYRCFTSLAGDLVAAGRRCPRCRTPLLLVPAAS